MLKEETSKAIWLVECSGEIMKWLLFSVHFISLVVIGTEGQ